MTANCQQIGNLVLRVETPFLDTPGLMLTVQQARRYFDVDAVTCQAVLDLLTEARVLTRAPEGTYRRHVPRDSGRPGMAA